MCTTYTWLAYGLPDRRQQRALPPSAPAAPMAGIREEDECAESEEAGRHPYGPCRQGRPRPRRARHWMGLAIVGVQMAAWCLVGALLMHRGVTTLKRRDAALLRDAFAAAPPPPSTASTATPGWTMQSDVAASSPSVIVPASTPTPTPSLDDASAEDEYLEASLDDLMKRWSSFVPARPPPGLQAPRDPAGRGLGEGFPFLPAADPAPGPAPGPALGGPGVLPGVGKAGTGAATAVVMVTVGGVMLVVGPAFMFIKIMDVYQRQKRLSKLSQHDDPPPSYDEVAEKAPRYSALFQVLENGELTPLSLPAEGAGTSAGPATAATAVASGEASPGTASASLTEVASQTSPAAVTRTASRGAAAPAPAAASEAEPAGVGGGAASPVSAVAGAGAPSADEDAEPDASTPLRPKIRQADDKSRRRSL